MLPAQTAGRALTLLLRIMGGSSLLALIFVAAPESWMVAIHAALDMGALPTAPVVGYLARITKLGSRYTVAVYRLNVERVDAEWEEQDLRRRRWVTAHDATKLLEGRPVAPVFRRGLQQIST